MKEGIVPQAAHIQVFIDFRYIASPPQVHQAMDLVDQRWRWGAGCIVPQAGAFTLIPWLQLHSAAGPFLYLFVSILARLILVAFLYIRLATGACHHIVACVCSGFL